MEKCRLTYKPELTLSLSLALFLSFLLPSSVFFFFFSWEMKSEFSFGLKSSIRTFC